MSERSYPVAPGDLVADKYRVDAILAEGGMGVVVAARHEVLEQRVAIKFLLPNKEHHAELTQRFLREARAAAKLQSDHVVRVLDVAEHKGTAYMVMEYLDGADLDDLQKQRGALGVGEAVSLIVQALDAVLEAHRLGIVHRDLKPANLFLSQRADGSRRVKVLDFGISKVAAQTGADARAITTTSMLMGSPGYMSPEQIRSARNVDARTDIWALGVILYELLTGGDAFTGETVGDVFAKIREESLPPISTLRADVPPELEAIVMRCLEKKRDDRYQDAVSLRTALLPFSDVPLPKDSLPELSGRFPVPSAPGVMAGPSSDGALDVPSTATPVARTGISWATTHDVRGRLGRRAVAVAAAVVFATLGAALVWQLWPNEPPSTTPASSEVGSGVPAAPELPTPAGAPTSVPTPNAAPSAHATVPKAAPSATVSYKTRPLPVPKPRPKSEDLGIGN